MFVNIGCAYSGKHDMLYFVQLDFVVVQILAKGSVERSDGVGCLDTDWADHHALLVNSYNLCC